MKECDNGIKIYCHGESEICVSYSTRFSHPE